MLKVTNIEFRLQRIAAIRQHTGCSLEKARVQERCVQPVYFLRALYNPQGS